MAKNQYSAQGSIGSAVRLAIITIVLAGLVASPFIGPFIGIAHAAGCNSPGCQVTANSNVPSSDGSIWVRIDNSTGSYCSVNPCTVKLPQTFTFPNATSHSIQALNNSFIGSSTGGRYIWKQWTIFYGIPQASAWVPQNTTLQMMRIPQILFNYTGAASFTAQFDKQYQYTLAFKNALGGPLNPAPVSVGLLSQSSGATITITSYSGQWLSSDKYTIAWATWEGASVGTMSTQILDLSNGPISAVVSLRAYPASILIIDKNGNPISGASATVTFVNSTSRSFTSDSNGAVQLGTIPQGCFAVTVTYQNQNAQVSDNGQVQCNSSKTVQLNVGGAVSGGIVSSVVLLTIFGVALFLVLLAIKVRKPPPPPTI